MNPRLITPADWLKPEQFPEADWCIAKLQSWENVDFFHGDSRATGVSPYSFERQPVPEYCLNLLAITNAVRTLPDAKREAYLNALQGLLLTTRSNSEFQFHVADSVVRATAYLWVMAPDFFKEAQP